MHLEVRTCSMGTKNGEPRGSKFSWFNILDGGSKEAQARTSLSSLQWFSRFANERIGGWHLLIAQMPLVRFCTQSLCVQE